MDVERWTVHYAWGGPLAEVDPPEEILYEVDMHFQGLTSLDPLQDALRGVAGEAKRRWHLRGTRLVWDKPPFSLIGTTRKGRIHLHAATRLQPKPLRRLVTALAAVPGAKDLEIDAQISRYCRPNANLRACSPCQAGKFR